MITPSSLSKLVTSRSGLTKSEFIYAEIWFIHDCVHLNFHEAEEIVFSPGCDEKTNKTGRYQSDFPEIPVGLLTNADDASFAS